MLSFKNKSYFVILMLLAGCSLRPAGENAKLTVEVRDPVHTAPFSLVDAQNPFIQASIAPPTNINGFDCFGINVDGFGIPSLSEDRSAVGELLAGDHCTGGGVTSKIYPISYAGSLDLFVPAGPSRVVQVIGLQSNIGCPNRVFSDYILESNAGVSDMKDNFPGIYEVGRQVTDIFGDTTVSIQNTYSQTNLKNLHTCGGTFELIPVSGLQGCDASFSTYTSLEYTTTSGSGTISTPLTGAELTSLQSEGSANQYVETCTNSAYYMRVDLMFDLTGIDVSDYEEIHVEAVATGGHAAGCSPESLPSSDYEVEMTAYKGSAASPGWASSHVATSTGVNNRFAYGYNVDYGGHPSDFVTNLNGTDYLVVSLRSTPTLNANCVTIEIKEVLVSLEKEKSS